LFGEDESRDLYLAPSVSPDGKKIAFIAQKDVFSIELYVADAETDKNMRKLVSSRRNAHFDALRFIDSAGSWSPDGKKFAFVVFAEGNNHLEIADVETGHIDRKIKSPAVDAIANPAWSPDGGSIAFSGSNGGVSDLFVM